MGDNGNSGQEAWAFKWRVIEPWHEPDGVSFFSHTGNIFTWADMLGTSPASALGRWIAQVRDWGFNGMALYADPETNPAAMRSFCAYLKENGIGLIIRREWCETETGRSWRISQSDGRPRTSEKLCPYSAEVRAYWQKRMAGDFAMMPGLAGYRMNATEYYFVNGAPWMCDCPQCRVRTPRERTRDAICLIAELLQEHGGTLFWETCQDDPWGQRQESFYFRDLTGAIPENAFIVHKAFYWDFHPGWPRHPLFFTIKPDAQGHSPYVTSLQAPGEYTGVHDFPWCMVDEWSGILRDMVALGEQGLWQMAIVDPDGWDHPLNRVNWYALQCFLRDPAANPAKIKLAWATDAFGADAAPTVVEVLHRVTSAARGMFEFNALWTANHSRFPTQEYLDSHLCGPYRQFVRVPGLMGMDLPLDMYSPERAARMKADPRTRMVFNRVPITPQLKAEAMAQKVGAVALMEEAIALWRGLEGRIAADAYDKILVGLEHNLNDAIFFRIMMDLYMDWKLGTLTEGQIDAALAACQGRHGGVMPAPLDPAPAQVTVVEPASMATFAEQLRRDLREPWVEAYWQQNPMGAGTVEPINYDP